MTSIDRTAMAQACAEILGADPQAIQIDIIDDQRSFLTLDHQHGCTTLPWFMVERLVGGQITRSSSAEP